MNRSIFSIGLLAGAALFFSSACDPPPRSRAGYEVTIPPGWKPWEGEPPAVPGDLLEAFTAPAGESTASLAIFRSPYLPGVTVQQLLAQRRFLLLNLPSLKIHEARELEVNGKPAALLDLTAEGTGKALSPTGLGKPIPPAGEQQQSTRRLWLILPRGPGLGTLELLFHCHESEHAKLAPAWEAILKSLKG
ncbi:MAG: hypothetical protein HY717_22160 [Planctomycetes bacterium]|nr:hypothetical protein [Planctomycetota bacterium]